MKIRTQLQMLVVSMILIPFLCASCVSILQYLTSPQHYLLKGYKQIRALDNVNFSEDDWEILKFELEKIPYNLQTMVYYNGTIILSNAQDVKSGTTITPIELFNYIRKTSDKYDYQIQSPRMRFSPKPKEKTFETSTFVIISRMDVSRKHQKPFSRFYLPTLIFMSIFEIACAIFVIYLSKKITNSITMLEKNTKKIAEGQLDTKLDVPHSKSNEITSLTGSLEEMRKALKDDQERRTKFIMGISHDLRTPVALIKGYAEAITDGVMSNTENITKSAEIINSKAEQLESMINDLINYVKLNQTDWLQSLEYLEIKPIILNFASNASATADVYKRIIKTNTNINDGLKIKMDKNLFVRVLENIFANAVRYTKEGDSISFVSEEKEKSVDIEISDSGIGINEKDKEHIFDIFYRGTNSRRESGMGIGLSVVKTIADAHGWNISVTSKENVGTTFLISIPK